MTEEKGKTQKQAQGRLQASHMAGGVREGAEGCGEGSENQRADSEWALQSEEAAAVPGTPEKLSCWPQALPEMDSLGPTRYWANGVSGNALLPALQSAGTRSAANDPSPGWGFKFPWLRALQNQHLQSRPRSHPNSLPGWHSGTIPHGPSCPSCAPHTNPCTAPVPRCALQSSLNHSPVTTRDQPGEFHCPSLLLHSPVPAAPLCSSRLSCCPHRAFPAPGSGSLSQLLPAGSTGIKGTAAPDLAAGRSREVIFSLAQAKRDRGLPPEAAAGS